MDSVTTRRNSPEVVGAIARLPLGRTSAFLVRGAAPILVDAGMPGQHAALLRRLRRLGLDRADIALVVVTHAHVDHTGGLPWVRLAARAPIVCHRETAAALRQGQSAALQPRTRLGLALVPLLRHGPRPPCVEPDLAIDHEISLEPYGAAGFLLPTPGHTRGCLSLQVGQDAIVGDLLMRRFGRHRPAVPFFLEDRVGWQDSVRLLLSRGVERFHTTHGGCFDAESVAALLHDAAAR